MKQRIIKFRAWDKEIKKMHKVYALDFDDRGYIYAARIGNLKVYPEENLGDQIEFMQYTGLKDKNGKEIYEGDVIEYKYYYAVKRWWNHLEDIPEIDKEVQEQRDRFEIHKKSVEFDRGMFVAGSLDSKDISRGELFNRGRGNLNDYEEKYWSFEVIGNIYENPEVLEKI